MDSFLAELVEPEALSPPNPKVKNLNPMLNPRPYHCETDSSSLWLQALCETLPCRENVPIGPFRVKVGIVTVVYYSEKNLTRNAHAA